MDLFRKIIIRHKRIDYDLNVMRQSACLVINPIAVDNFAALLNCSLVGRVSDSMMARPKAIHLSCSFVCCLVHRSSTDDLLLLQILSGVISGVLWQTRDLHLSHSTLSWPEIVFNNKVMFCSVLYLFSLRLCFFIVLIRDLFVYRDESLTS